MLDTNCDPDEVDFPIPGNDDAIRSAALLTRVVADAVAAGLIARPGKALRSGSAEAEAGAGTVGRATSPLAPSGSASCCRARAEDQGRKRPAAAGRAETRHRRGSAGRRCAGH